MARRARRVLGWVGATTVVAGAALGIAALAAGWTLPAYGRSLSIAGLVAMSLGFVSVFGAYQTRGDAFYLQAQALQHAQIHERATQHLRDIGGSHAFALVMVVAGLALLASGLLVAAAG